MTDDYEEKIDKVLETELDEINERRDAVGLNKPSDERKLVGLALSGGGIRSGSLNLGLLQVLYQKGILRHIDYLSTVSGGGYVGSFLSTLTSNSEKEINWIPEGRSSSNNENTLLSKDDAAIVKEDKAMLDIIPDKNGRQPAKLQELSYAGMYLRHPLTFTSQLVFGALLINVFTFSALIAFCAVIAYLYRLLDSPQAIDWLSTLGFYSDLRRAFVPAFILFILWFVSFSLSILFNGFRRKIGPMVKGLCAGMFITLVLAFVALLNTGDIDISQFTDQGQVISDVVNSNKTGIQVVLFIIFALAMIPFFKFPQLLRSGTKPRNPMESWIFSIVSRVFLYGTPLLVFGFLAKEDVSGWMDTRNNQYVFARTHIKDWNKFLTHIDLFSKESLKSSRNGQEDNTHPSDTLKSNLNNGVHQYLWKLANFNKDIYASKFLENYNETEHWKKNHWVWKKILLMFDPVNGHRKLVKINESLNAQRQFRDRFAKLINQKVLLNPRFYEVALVPENNENKLVLTSGDKNLSINLSSIAVLSNKTIPINNPEALKLFAKNGKQLHYELQELQINQQGNLFKFYEKYHKDDPLPTLNPFDNDNLGLNEWLVQVSHLLNLVEKQHHEDNIENHSSLHEVVSIENAIRQNNWMLLKAIYGNNIREANTVFAAVVLAKDQDYRFSVFLWCAAISVVTGFMWNWNSISIQQIYRDQLAKLWIDPTGDYGYLPRLSKVVTVTKGGPYHIINASINYFGRKMDHKSSMTGCFMMSQKYCGSKRTGYGKTKFYQNGKFDIASAMAVSGAAVSPTIVQNPLLRVLLLLSNFRLGEWLPNPKYRIKTWPSPIRLLFGYWRNAPEDREFCFINDGGHNDNSGIGSLLERRCRIIIACDASHDPQYRFVDFMNVVTSARAKFGVQILPLDAAPDHISHLSLDDLIPTIKWKGWTIDTANSLKKAKSHFIVCKILYPFDELSNAAGLSNSEESRTGYLIYLKPNFDGDEDSELIHHKLENPNFPHDTTLDQFYEPRRFENYRHLGFHMGKALINYLNSKRPNSEDSDGNEEPWLAAWHPPKSPPKTQSINPNQIEKLIKQLKHADPDVREKALCTLEKATDKDIVNFPKKLITQIIKGYNKETNSILKSLARGILFTCEPFHKQINVVFDQTSSRTTSNSVHQDKTNP